MAENSAAIARPEGRSGGKRASGRRTKFVVGGIVVVATVIYLVISAASGGATFYMTVGEVKSQGPTGRNARVSGNAVGDTIVWDDRGLVLRFDIEDQSGILSVTYRGPRPDMLRDGAEVVVEGRLADGDVFEADQLILKCPSKYEEAASNG